MSIKLRILLQYDIRGSNKNFTEYIQPEQCRAMKRIKIERHIEKRLDSVMSKKRKRKEGCTLKLQEERECQCGCLVDYI